MSCTSLPHHKKVDIFAPSKAIQDAKDKLGPMYFDISLLACSKNAVELTKLVHEWETLEKKRAKKMKDMNKDQINLMNKLKKQKSRIKESRMDLSKEAVNFEDATKGNWQDRPPGFRFCSNGNLKKTQSQLPMFSSSFAETNSHRKGSLSGRSSSLSSISKRRSSQADTYASVDYDKEINDLEGIIHEIYTDLSKSKINLYSISAGTYLRAHHNEYKAPAELIGLTESDRKFSRLNLGSSTNNAVYSDSGSRCTNQKDGHRSHHTCSACEEKLQAENERMADLRKRRQIDGLKKQIKNAESVTHPRSAKSTPIYHATNKPSLSRYTPEYKWANKKQTLRFSDQQEQCGFPDRHLGSRSKSATKAKLKPQRDQMCAVSRSPASSSVKLFGIRSDFLSEDSFKKSAGSRVSSVSGVGNSSFGSYCVQSQRPSIEELKRQQVNFGTLTGNIEFYIYS